MVQELKLFTISNIAHNTREITFSLNFLLGLYFLSVIFYNSKQY